MTLHNIRRIHVVQWWLRHHNTQADGQRTRSMLDESSGGTKPSPSSMKSFTTPGCLAVHSFSTLYTVPSFQVLLQICDGMLWIGCIFKWFFVYINQHFSPAWAALLQLHPAFAASAASASSSPQLRLPLHGYSFSPGITTAKGCRKQTHQTKAKQKQNKRNIRQLKIFCGLLRSPGCQFFLSTMIKERVATARLTSLSGPLVGCHSLISDIIDIQFIAHWANVNPVGPGSAQSVWAPCKPKRDASTKWLQHVARQNFNEFTHSKNTRQYFLYIVDSPWLSSNFSLCLCIFESQRMTGMAIRRSSGADSDSTSRPTARRTLQYEQNLARGK